MIDLDATVLAVNFATFGESVTYTPTSGSPVSLTGIFNIAHREIGLGEGAPVSSRLPLLDLRAADLATAAIAANQGDQVTCRGVAYCVNDVRPDGNGVVQLGLNEA